MRYMRAIWVHTAGLFVDDVPFAAAILVWLAVTCLVLPRAGVARTVLAIPMLLGLAAILLASAVQRARHVSKQSATKS